MVYFCYFLESKSTKSPFPLCKDGKGPLLEGPGNPFPCATECPDGFNCEYPIPKAPLGICCPDLELLYKLYGHSEEASEEEEVAEGSKVSGKDIASDKNKTLEAVKDSGKNKTSEVVKGSEKVKTPELVKDSGKNKTSVVVKDAEKIKTPKTVKDVEKIKTPKTVKDVEKNKTSEVAKGVEKDKVSKISTTTEEPEPLDVIEEVEELDEIEPVAEEVKKARLYVLK